MLNYEFIRAYNEAQNSSYFEELIRNYSYDDIIKFFDDSREVILSKEDNGVLGRFAESLGNTTLAFYNLNNNVKVCEGETVKPFTSIIKSSPKGKVDLCLETDNALYNGSFKESILSHKRNSSMSVAKSNIVTELNRSSSHRARAKKANKIVYGVLAIYESKLNLKEYYDQTIGTGLCDELLIIPFGNVNFDTSGYKGKIKVIPFKTIYTSVRTMFSKVDYKVNALLNDENETITLYPFQEECINALKELLAKHDVVCTNLFCRAGKTVITPLTCSALFKDYRGAVVIVQSFKPDIFDGFEKTVKKLFGDKVVVHNDNGKGFQIDENRLNIALMSGQYTYAKMPKKEALKLYKIADAIIIDEAHVGFNTNRQKELRKNLKKGCKVILSTATNYYSYFSDFPTVSYNDKFRFGYTYVQGNLEYINNPFSVHIPLVIEDCYTGNPIVFNSADELFSNKKNVENVILGYFNMCINGVEVKDVIDGIRKVACDESLINGQEEKVFPRTHVFWAENISYAKIVEDILPIVSSKIREKINCVRWDTENMNFVHSKYKTLQDCVDSMFTVERDTMNVLILVGCGTCGVNMNNLDAMLMLHDSTNAALNVQQWGRTAQPSRNINGTYNRLTPVFDVFPNRRLAVIKEQEYYDNPSCNPEHIRKTAEYESIFSLKNVIIKADGSVKTASYSDYSFDNLYKNLIQSQNELGITHVMNNVVKVPDEELAGYTGNKNLLKMFEDIFFAQNVQMVEGDTAVLKKTCNKGSSKSSKNKKTSYEKQMCFLSEMMLETQNLVCMMTDKEKEEFQSQNSIEEKIEYLLDFGDKNQYKGISYFKCASL